MKKTITITITTIFLGVLLLAGVVSASDADILQPASTVTYNEDLTVNGTGRFDSVYIGKQGVGGVTFFNGTIINATVGEDDFNNPVTFGDNVRIDGKIYRTEEGGVNPLKIADTLIPASAHDLGTSNDRWNKVWSKDANFSGSVMVQGGAVWTSQNDGAGSGLNADKLDGKTSSDFALKIHNHDDRYWKKDTYTRYWSVTGNLFQPKDEGCSYTKSGGAGYLSTGNDCDYLAHVNLPNGAVIKEVRMEYVDDNSDYFGVQLLRSSLTDGYNELMAQIYSDTDDAGVHTKNAAIIASPNVDTENNAYLLQTDNMTGAAGIDHKLASVRIKYTVTEPLP